MKNIYKLSFKMKFRFCPVDEISYLIGASSEEELIPLKNALDELRARDVKVELIGKLMMIIP